LAEVNKSKPDLRLEKWRGFERKLVVVAFPQDRSVQRLRKKRFLQPFDTEFLPPLGWLLVLLLDLLRLQDQQRLQEVLLVPVKRLLKLLRM
jgi:hypothetical protein